MFFAKRKIEKGEEITYDYQFPFEGENVKCNCGSDNCKGILN